MAKINMLAADGRRPNSDVYTIKQSDLLVYFKKIIKDTYGVDMDIRFHSNDGDETDIRAYFTEESLDNLSYEVADQMQDNGMDPGEMDEVTNYLTFELAGGMDAHMEFRCFDPDANPLIDVYMPAREDLKIKSVELLETSLNGTRDETIIEINRLVRYIKGDEPVRPKLTVGEALEEGLFQ